MYKPAGTSTVLPLSSSWSSRCPSQKGTSLLLGDVTCVLLSRLSSPDNRQRIQKRMCPNVPCGAQELNMKRHSCSKSLRFVTAKLSLTWNHVENKQGGKGHVNNSFPQNQASHICYCILLLLLLALETTCILSHTRIFALV